MTIKKTAAITALTGALVLGVAVPASAGTSGWTAANGWVQSSGGIINWQKTSLGGGMYRAKVEGPATWTMNIKAHFVLLGQTHTTNGVAGLGFATTTADHMTDFYAWW